MTDDLGVELFLAVEVPIEAAMRKVSGRHDLADRNFGEPFPIEQTGSCTDDPLPGPLLVFWRVRHQSSFTTKSLIRAKDDLEHLLSVGESPPANTFSCCRFRWRRLSHSGCCPADCGGRSARRPGWS